MGIEVEGVWVISTAQGMDLSEYDGLVFQFDNGTLYGNSPCRSFNAEYRFDSPRLTILRPDVFGGMCDEQRMDAESAFLRLLNQVDGARVDDTGVLVLESFGDAVMRADPRQP